MGTRWARHLARYAAVVRPGVHVHVRVRVHVHVRDTCMMHFAKRHTQCMVVQ